MSKEKEKSEELHPDSSGSQKPVYQSNPLDLPEEPIDSETKTREIPIGVPISKEELKKLKEDSLKKDQKKKKRKAPDKGQ